MGKGTALLKQRALQQFKTLMQPQCPPKLPSQLLPSAQTNLGHPTVSQDQEPPPKPQLWVMLGAPHTLSRWESTS